MGDPSNGKKAIPTEEADTDRPSETSDTESDEEEKAYYKWLAEEASRELRRRREALDRPAV